MNHTPDNKTIYRIIKNPENPYVMVDKRFVNNPNLSWKAKGILLYLLSKPDDWEIYESDIEKHATDGRDACRSGIRELENAGHIKRVQHRDENGRMSSMEYHVYETSTVDVKSVDGNPVDGKADTTNNNITNNKKQTNTSGHLSPRAAALFNELWNLYPRKRGKGQVSAANQNKLYEIGYAQMVRCIDRFMADMKAQNRAEDKYPYGSTFFNSGYIDYLDENYTEVKPKKPFKIKM